MNTNEKDLLSLNEFAFCAGIHYNTVRKMIKSGRLSAFKIGSGGLTSNYKIPKSEIHRLSLLNLEQVVEKLVDDRINEQKENLHFRFFSKVEKTDSCWLWKGARTKSGYGVFSLNCKYIRAHRASYIIHNGDIPKDCLVLHSCDVRDCVNPNHIHLGTPKDNMDEMKQRNRQFHLKGIDHPFCKISDEQVEEIIEMRKNKIKPKEIAKKFNITANYVYQIYTGLYRNRK